MGDDTDQWSLRLNYWLVLGAQRVEAWQKIMMSGI